MARLGTWVRRLAWCICRGAFERVRGWLEYLRWHMRNPGDVYVAGGNSYRTALIASCLNTADPAWRPLAIASYFSAQK